MPKRIVAIDTIYSMIKKDMDDWVGARRYIRFRMVNADHPDRRYLPYRNRCVRCKVMIEHHEIKVDCFNPARTRGGRRSEYYHFRPCFATYLSSFVKQLDKEAQKVIEFRAKYDI